MLATGTASGALDESFSSGASLELWDAFGEGDEESRIKGRVSVTSKFVLFICVTRPVDVERTKLTTMCTQIQLPIMEQA